MRKLAALVLFVVGLIAAYVWSSRSTEDPGELLAADAPSATTEIARVRLEARERGEIDVSPCSAGGRVLDLASGRGVSGALVQLRPHGFGRPTMPDDAGAPLTASTDDDGAWTISRLAAGRYVLTASAPDHLPGQRGDLALRSGQANTGLDLALERGGHPLRGTVSDVSGGPIEGVVIAIEGEGDGNMARRGSGGICRRRTGPGTHADLSPRAGPNVGCGPSGSGATARGRQHCLRILRGRGGPPGATAATHEARSPASQLGAERRWRGGAGVAVGRAGQRGACGSNRWSS